MLSFHFLPTSGLSIVHFSLAHFNSPITAGTSSDRLTPPPLSPFYFLSQLSTPTHGKGQDCGSHQSRERQPKEDTGTEIYFYVFI